MHSRGDGLPWPFVPTGVLLRTGAAAERDYPATSPIRVRAAEMG